MEIVYGKRVHNSNDEFISLSRKATASLSQSHLPGVFLIDSFPWLRYLPSWFPGSSARKFAEVNRPIVEAARCRGFDDVAKAMVRYFISSHPSEKIIENVIYKENGTAVDCVTKIIIERLQKLSESADQYLAYEELGRDVSGVSYADKHLSPAVIGGSVVMT